MARRKSQQGMPRPSFSTIVLNDDPKSHAWVKSIPTFRDDEECAVCDHAREEHDE